MNNTEDDEEKTMDMMVGLGGLLAACALGEDGRERALGVEL